MCDNNRYCVTEHAHPVRERRRESEKIYPLSTDLGLFTGFSRRPSATRGPGGGLASTGGNDAAPFDFFFDFSFFSFSGLVGVVGMSSWLLAGEGTASLSLSLSVGSLPVMGCLDLLAVER